MINKPCEESNCNGMYETKTVGTMDWEGSNEPCDVVSTVCNSCSDDYGKCIRQYIKEQTESGAFNHDCEKEENKCM